MNITKELIKFAGVAVIMASASTANAEGRPFMARGETVAAPPGFTDLCQRDEASCGSPAAMVAPATPMAMAALSTASLGRTWPMAMAAIARQASVAADEAADDAGPGLVAVETVQAYQPESVADFLPAGTLRPAPHEPILMATGAVRLGRDQVKLVTRINLAVNRDVRKANDFDIYGMPEFWSLPRVIDGKMYGDCEDYALEKRRRLIAAGVPAQALSMAVAVTQRGERHAVLVASFESGDVVLDNLTPWPTPWTALNYTWVQRQVAGSSAWTVVS